MSGPQEVNVGLHPINDAERRVLERMLFVKEGQLPVDELLRADPDLLRYHRAAEEIALQEREEFNRLPRARARQSSIASRVAVEYSHAEHHASHQPGACDPHEGLNCCSVAWARLYRYLFSEDFNRKLKRNEVVAIVGDLSQEVIIAFGMDTIGPLVLKQIKAISAQLKVFLEKLCGASAGRAMLSAAPAIGIFLLMVFTTPGSGSWEGLPHSVVYGALKTGAALLTSCWVSVPLIMFADSCAEQYKWLVDAGHSGPSAVAHSLKGAFLNLRPVSYLQQLWEYVFSTQTHMQITEDMLHPDDFVHDSFLDVCGEMGPMVDPVFLHGFQFSRETAEGLFQHGIIQHPFTRARIMRVHVQEPEPEWTRLYNLYMSRRHFLIQESCGAPAQT